MPRALLLYNPVAGRRRLRRLAGAERELTAAGWVLERSATRGAGDATRLARQAAAAGCEAVFAFGGDGTLREAAAGLLGSEVPLGFLPAGTVNVMSRVFGLPPEPVGAARALRRGTARAIDVGSCAGQPFLMLASAGLDARVVAGLRPGVKRRFGRAAVLPALAAGLLRYDFPLLRLSADGEPLTARWAAVANVPYYGGGWRLLPDAAPDDGRLDLLVHTGPGRAAALGVAADIFLGRGRHLRRRDVAIRRVERVVIEAPMRPELQLDGDAATATAPVEIALEPRRLRVLVPAP